MKKDYLIIFIIALFLRAVLAFILFYYFGEEGFIAKDSAGQYLPLAENLALGKGFTLGNLIFYAYKAPGYPIFLAFFYKIFGVFWPAIIVQIILSSFLAVLIYKISETIGLDRKISWLAAILTASGPHLVYYGNIYVTESLFAFLFLLGILFFIKFLKKQNLRYALFSGIFLGLDALVKVSAQYLVFAFLPSFILFLCFYPVARKKNLLLGFIIFIFTSAFIIAPLAIRNYKNFGTLNLNSQGAYLLYRYGGVSIISVRDKIPYGEAEKIARKELLLGTGLENVPEHELVDLKYAPILSERTFSLLKSNIEPALKVGLINAFSFWTHSNYAYLLSVYKIISSPILENPPSYLLAQGNLKGALKAIKSVISSSYYLVALFSRLFWFLVAFFSAAGFFFALAAKKNDKERKYLVLLIGLTIIYFNITLLPLGFGIEARLRYNVEPLMFLLVSLGFYTAFQKIKDMVYLKRTEDI